MELMKRSHIVQAHSTTYHPQTKGLVERQNRTLVNMLRVYCSRYMTDWDKYLPQVVGAYNSTQHSTTGISPFMMLTGKERAMPLTFFYPEYEGKRTSPQAYVKEASRRQQKINELCRRNTAQAQMRQRKKYDEKILQAKPYEVGQYVWVFQNVIPPKGTKKLLKKWRGPFMITEVHQQRRFYRLSTGRAAHYENLKPHIPSPEDWCVPKDMEGLEYLLVEPACEVNEKGTRDKNDGNENLSLDDNEKIDADSEAESFVEEDWNDPDQGEVPKWTEPDLSIPAGTRSGNRKRTGMRYNRYGDDFLIDKIKPDDLCRELTSVGELAADGEWQIINDNEHYPQEDYSTPERETDLEQSEIERRKNTNLRILEWMRDVKNESEEGQSIQSIQQERAMPLRFFYPEYEGKRTSPQAYVKEASRRQQEINELCRRNTAQAQMRQRKKYDEKILQAEPYEVGQYVWVFQNVIPPKGTKKLLKKRRGPFMITEVHQQRRFYRLSTGRAAHYENLKPHIPSPEDWCVPKDMEGLEYLLVEPACEVNEKGTRDKNDGNENLSLDDNEKIDADSEAESFVEEVWNDPDQGEVPKWTEPDLSIPAGTRSGNRKRTGMRYNRYGDDFLIDKIKPDDLCRELTSVGELAADGEWQIINDNEHYPQEDYSTPERETDLEQSEIEKRKNTNLRILEWMRDVKNESEEGQSIQSIQQERAMPLTFFYPEYEGKRTSPQAYVKEASRRQQEINELCRRNTAQAQMRQRKKYDVKYYRRSHMKWASMCGFSRM